MADLPLPGSDDRTRAALEALKASKGGVVLIGSLAGLYGLPYNSLYSMTKIWGEAFWKGHPEGDAAPCMRPVAWTAYAPVVMFGLLTLWIGLNAQPLFNYAELSAAQLLAPDGYIDAVLPAEYVSLIRNNFTQP